MTQTNNTIMAELDTLFNIPLDTTMHVGRLWELWELCGKRWGYAPPKNRGHITRERAVAYAKRLCPGWRDPREVEILQREVERLKHEITEYKERITWWREECKFLYDEWYALKRQSAPAIPEHYATLHLLPGAPPEVVSATHKALVRLHHPDLGGDTATMQAINAAVDQVRKEVQS